jgi:hypothetical protein
MTENSGGNYMTTDKSDAEYLKLKAQINGTMRPLLSKKGTEPVSDHLRSNPELRQDIPVAPVSIEIR